MHGLLLYLLTVCTCFYMGSVHKDLAGIYQASTHTLPQDMGKDLSEEVRILETAGVVLSKGRKMRDWVHHVQTKGPAVSNIDLDLADGLAHALDPKKVLYERDLDQHDRIHAGPSIVMTISPFHEVIDKTPVDGPVDQPE